MRMLTRLFLFWILLLPAAYIWGLPYLTDFMESKTREQNFAACKQQIADSGMQMTTQQADNYCHCLNDGVHFEDGDLITIASTRQAPEHVRIALEQQINICTDQLTRELQGGTSAPAAAPTAPEKTNSDGSVEVFL